ncbi:MAG: hypothetical protein U5R14_14675 [Gemmatimonadota bacterium]|nr:hypothetical protein [Gemmatimonadota bacterium]
MAASVAATCERRSFSAPDIETVRKALHLAMEPREAALDDDHHPAFLHPGRVALVLLNDVDGAPAPAVVLGTLLESRDPQLRADSEKVAEAFGTQVADARSSVPAPGAPDLAERLVTLPPDIALGALAERLDHLRHEHLREPVIPWATLVDEVSGVWLPVAERASEALARRYRHWLRTFRRRARV